MNDMQAFVSSLYSPRAISSRTLTGMQPQMPAASTTPDGSKFFTDSSGEVIYAQYASGAIVSRQKKQVAVRTADGDYWLGTFAGMWFRVD